MSSSPSAARRDRGFSLPELLVAIVIAGILATAIFQFLQGQTRFVTVQSGREEVQQNVRGALDLITGDLRAAPASGLVSAGSNSVEFFLPRAWGVLCPAPVGGAYSSTQVDVLFPEGLPAELMDISLQAGASPYGLHFRESAGVWKPDATGALRAIVLDSDPAPAVPAGTTSCADSLGAQGVVPTYRFTGEGFPTVMSTGAPLQPGIPVYFYQTVRYEVSTSSGLPGLWIRRSYGAGDPQPLAGPLPDDAGLDFRYFRNLSSAAETTPIADPAVLSALERVQVRVTTESRSKEESARQVKRDSMMVYLRNR